MAFDRRFVATSALVFTVAVGFLDAQEKAPEKTKLSRAEMTQYQGLHTLVDAVMAGKQPAPADLKLKFQNHFVKSTTTVFVPYVLEISSGKLSSFPVAMYVRAVRKSEAPPVAATGSKPQVAAEKKADDYPFENIYFFADSKNLVSTGPDTVEVSRALDLAPGQYDVYIALSEAPPKGGGTTSPAKKVVLVQPLTVPDFSVGLMTSTVILGKQMEEAPQHLTPQQQVEQPFTLAGYKITPTFSSAFPKAGEFLFVFMVYNEAAAAGGKPDLSVDYNVFRASEAKPFSKLATMVFNGTTLPAEFSLSAGHQVMVVQGFPLASFVPGDYKLEIKVTDKTDGQAILRNVPFTVTP